MPGNNHPERIRHARGSSGQQPDAGLARQLGELAREMQADPGMASLVQHIVEATAREVEHADYAGITVVERNRVRSEAATDDIVARLDGAQHRLGQGPCLNSLREEVTVRSADFKQENRWPDFVAVAMGEGVQSMLSVQLFVEGDNLGALDLYLTEPNVFDDEDESIAMLLAAHAAVAMKGSSVESNLRIALESRDAIGQAKGVLMERYKIGPTEAFGLLVMGLPAHPPQAARGRRQAGDDRRTANRVSRAPLAAR
jgi:GAF domain-containing protein